MKDFYVALIWIGYVAACFRGYYAFVEFAPILVVLLYFLGCAVCSVPVYIITELINGRRPFA